MSDLKEIKKHIYEDDRIEEILDLLGCENIHTEGGKLIVAQLPPKFLSRNKRAVQVTLDKDLNCNIRNRDFNNGDIYGLVSYLHHGITDKEEIRSDTFYAKQWIVDMLGYHSLIGFEDKPKSKINDWVKKIKKNRKKRNKVESQKPNKVISEDVLRYYKFMPYYYWYKEGIMPNTQIEWETGFDIETHRVINPVRNINGELIGVKGRAIGKNYDKDKKYIYLHQCNKSIEIYGLHKTLPYILEKKEIILFEGYKSVMKAWQMGYKHCGSIEGDEISDYQVALIKSLGIDIKIVLAFDKDKFFEVIENKETEEKEKVFSMKYIESQGKKFTNRKVYTIDKEDKLEEKMSPVDKGLKIWSRLYKNKIML